MDIVLWPIFDRLQSGWMLNKNTYRLLYVIYLYCRLSIPNKFKKKKNWPQDSILNGRSGRDPFSIHSILAGCWIRITRYCNVGLHTPERPKQTCTSCGGCDHLEKPVDVLPSVAARVLSTRSLQLLQCFTWQIWSEKLHASHLYTML